MSLTVGELNAKLSLDSRAFDSGLSGAERSFGGFGSKIGKSIAALGIGAAIGSAVTKGIGAFSSLETGMLEVFTLMPGISETAMSEMTDQVKTFAKDFGVLPDEVVPALYQSISAGVPAGNVFEFLETAQAAAKGGVTDLATAVDGISSVVNAYGSDVVSAAEASDAMFTAVRLGKTNFEELSQSLFQVIPTASSIGVEFGDVTSALAAMTAQGTPTSVATTQLRQALVELSKEGSGASDTFKEISGKSFKDFLAGGGNMQDAMEMMSSRASAMGLSVSDLFGSVEAGNAVLALTSESGSAAFSNALDEMSTSAGATQAASDTMSTGLQDSFNKIKAAAAVGAASFGEKLAPAVALVVDWILENWPKISAKVSEVMEAIREAIEPVVLWLVEFWAEHGEAILATLAETWAQIQEVISAAMEFIDALVTAVLGGIRIIWEEHGETIMAVVSVAFEFIRRTISNVLDIVQRIFRAFAALFRGDWSALWDEIKGIFSALWDQIQALIVLAWDGIGAIWGDTLDSIGEKWSEVWGRIKDGFSAIWDGIKGTLRGGVNGLISLLESGLNRIVAGVNSIIRAANKIPGVSFSEMPGVSLPRLHRGGTVPGVPGSETAFILRAGERVVDSGSSVLPGGTQGVGGSATQIYVTTPTREAREISREIAWTQAYELRVAG